MAANSGRTPFFIIIILLLLLINGALFYFNQKGEEENDEQTEVIADLSDEIALKKEQLVSYRDSIQVLYKEVGENDSLSTEMKVEIEKLNTFIGSLEKKNNFNRRKLDEAQGQINYYSKVVDNFELQIGQLKMANERMAEQIRVEQEDNSRLVTQIEETKADIASLQTQKEEVITQKTQLSEAKDALEERLQVASILQLSRTYLKGYKTNRRGKTIYTDKTKRTERLEVCIEIMPNSEAREGDQDFTIVITDPKGQVVPTASNGSGSFKTLNGENKRYTEIMTADYNGQKGIFCNNWAEPKFRDGIYSLEVFYRGHSVGASDMKLD